MFVIGRGVEPATAREIALKLTETCRVAAEPLTATDLVHGPLAALDPFFPVGDRVAGREPARGRRRGGTRPRGRRGDRRERERGGEIAGAAYSLPVPAAGDRLFAPLLSVVPGQLFAAALARAKGLDADRPDRLTKVMLAR